MESFFLAETTKYLYLLFDEANFIHNHDDSSYNEHTRVPAQCLLDRLGYVFNTEAHPFDIGAIGCCKNYDRTLRQFLNKQIVGKYNDSIRTDDYLTGKYRCKSRPFYQRLFTNGAYLEDKYDLFS